MKMIFLWAILTFVFAFRVKELNRWTVGLYVAANVANVVFAYTSF